MQTMACSTTSIFVVLVLSVLARGAHGNLRGAPKQKQAVDKPLYRETPKGQPREPWRGRNETVVDGGRNLASSSMAMISRASRTYGARHAPVTTTNSLLSPRDQSLLKPASAPSRSPSIQNIFQAAPPFFLTPPNFASSNEQTWLNSHNTRRKKLHEANGVSYVPLEWSDGLAASASKYGNLLASSFSDCHIEHGYQGDGMYGEILAATWGGASGPSVEAVLTGLFENEANLGYPANGHYTQIGWRATKWVGCADISKTLSGGVRCWIQVCRYATTGNCNLSSSNFKTKMLADSSPCTPQCPPEGC
jgi:Cysteine-rich secretory protein family